MTGGPTTGWAIRASPSSHAVAVDTQMEVKVPTDVGINQTGLIGVDFVRNAMKDYGESYDVATLDVFDPHYGDSSFDSLGAYTDSDTVLRQIGLYAQDQVEIGDLTFVFGGRYDFAQVDTDDHLIDAVSKQRDEAFTGRVGAIYTFDFGLAPYASYSTSFNPTVGTDAGNTPFEPSKGKQVEAGHKYQPPGYDAMITVAAFQITETNTLTTDPDDPNFSVQRGEIRSRGIEVEAKTSLEFGLDLTAAYSYNDVALTKDEDGNKGNTPSATPPAPRLALGGLHDPAGRLRRSRLRGRPALHRRELRRRRELVQSGRLRRGRCGDSLRI